MLESTHSIKFNSCLRYEPSVYLSTFFPALSYLQPPQTFYGNEFHSCTTHFEEKYPSVCFKPVLRHLWDIVVSNTRFSHGLGQYSHIFQIGLVAQHKSDLYCLNSSLPHKFKNKQTNKPNQNQTSRCVVAIWQSVTEKKRFLFPRDLSSIQLTGLNLLYHIRKFKDAWVKSSSV